MIRIMSKTISKISYLVIFIISLVLIIYFFLLQGISIKHLYLPYANIQKLYIKLDKKLIVKADYIKIKKNYSSESTKSQLISVKNYLKYFHLIFKNIDIKKIQYENNLISLNYKNNIFFLETNQLYFLSSIILNNKSIIKIDIKKLYLKHYQASFTGMLNINLINNKFEYDGTFFTHDLNGKAKLTLKNNMLYYYLYDTKTNSIAPFMDYLNSKLKINKIISNWIYKYIVAKHYDLEYLSGRINTKTGNFYPLSLQGAAKANNATVSFNKKLPSVKVKQITATLKNDTLSFNLLEPTYKGIKLQGSFVKITNLVGKGSFIEVIIKTNSALNHKILTILKTYNIKIPLLQIKSKTNGIVKLTMPFSPFKIDVKGFFTTQNAAFLFNGIRFATKHANISLHNHIIKLNNTSLSYKNIFDINTTGILNVRNNRYDGNIYINKLFLKYKNKILLNTSSIKSKININFTKHDISIKAFNANLIFNKNKNYFIFHNLNKIYAISPLLEKFNLKNGNIEISTKDFKNFILTGDITYNKQNILLYKNKKIKKFNFIAKIDKNSIQIRDKNRDIKVNIKKNNIKLQTNKISFDLNNTKNKLEDNMSRAFTIEANNSIIFLPNNINIKTDKFSFYMSREKKIFSSIYKTNQIKYFQSSNITNISTNFITSKYLNNLLGHNIFHGGKFKFIIKEKDKHFLGTCYIINSAIKSIKKGGEDFKINTGNFNFDLNNSILNLKNIQLKNDFSILKGGGYINLKRKKINLIFHVEILKKLGKAINSIPFLGYIILGKKGKFTTKVIISGKLENPKIKTDFTESIIKSPINILFRIIKTPFKLFLPNKKTNPSK